MFGWRKGIYFQTEPTSGGGEPSKQEPPADDGKFPATWEEVFKHPRFKELATRTQTAEAELQRIKAAEKEANDKALAEQNRWQQLAEQREKELATEKVANLRLKVASSKGLPVELVERLRGETEDDIAKDADGLLALIKPTEEKNSKGLPRTRIQQSAGTIDFQTETDPKKIREAVRSGQTQ